MTKLEKMYKQMEKAFGHYIWIDDYSTKPGEVDIQVANDLACECEDIINEAGFKIVDESEFSGSSYDGVVFTIKVA